MRRKSTIIIAAVMAFLLASCSHGSETQPIEPLTEIPTKHVTSMEETDSEKNLTNTQTESEKRNSETTLSAESDKEKESEDTSGILFSKEAEESLIVLRQNMENMPAAVCGAAYLGWRNEGETESITEWLYNQYPGMIAVLPFIGEIPEDHILGNGHGDLYCIVPQEENLVLEVQRITWNAIGNNVQPELEEILYKSEKDDPVLVYVQHGKIPDETDIRILFTAKDGHVEELYPFLDNGSENTALNVPVNENFEALILDFSFFGDVGNVGWMTPGDDWWLSPTELGLADTKWCTENGWLLHLAYDESNPSCAGGAVLYHPCEDETGSYYERDCHGDWWMEGEDLYLNLTDDTGEFVGGLFPVLISPSGEELRIDKSTLDDNCPPFFEKDMSSMVLNLSYESLKWIVSSDL